MQSKYLAPLAAAVSLALIGTAQADERYIVAFKEGKGPQVKAAAQGLGGQVKLELKAQNALAMALPAQALKGLQNNPNVDFVEADVKRYPLAQTVPYGITMVQAPLVSDAFAANRTVCIIDSGYDNSHEDLSSNSVTGSSDPTGAGDWFDDTNHHGTHVAGTIAAYDNSVGVVGVNPHGTLKLHIVKVFDENGWAYSSSLVGALNKCVENGANVINMSLGGSLKSRTEDQAFTQAYNNGVLSVAAAGNDGNTRHSYPASYNSVISVAAIDQNKAHADFSQRTSQVELSAPGVSVLSTVPMGTALVASASVGSSDFEAIGMEGSPLGSPSGALADCGTGESTCDADQKICLIARGNISFADKVLACQNGGGLGAIIYNNEPGALNGTLGEVVTAIPSVGVTADDGAQMLGQLGQSATVDIGQGNYAYYDGTSMATPHVAGVAALVWSHHDSCSAAEIRSALTATAEDLGVAGRDDSFGYGLVQAKAADDYLSANPCGSGSGGGSGGNGGNPGKGKGGKK